MQLLRGIVNDSTTLQANQTINVQPFRLDPVTAERPIEYEITFLVQNVRYQFGFTLTPRKISERMADRLQINATRDVV